MIYLNPTFLSTSRSAVFQDADSSSWLQIPNTRLWHRLGVWDGKWPHRGDPAALTASPEEGLSAYIVFWMSGALALLGHCPFWCLVVCPALMANSSFLIKVSQQPLGFMLHLELGNTDIALPTARWLRRNESDKKVSMARFLLSAAQLVLLLCTEFLVFQASGLILWWGSASLAAAPGQVKFSLVEMGKVCGEGEIILALSHQSTRKGLGALGNFGSGRGE